MTLSNIDQLRVIGREQNLFVADLSFHRDFLDREIRKSKFLVIGGAGSIGSSLSIEIFKRNPMALHIVDISENNTVELVRELRSSIGYISGDFKTYAIDCGSVELEALIKNEGPYDYVFNLSALKHVRSEKDPYTLMRMIEVNILNAVKIAKMCREMGAKKYFCVSTDKAANPVNMMGASKRIMELHLMRESLTQNISLSRFANVAFSDGSLLHGFLHRISKRQPISAPYDVKRYFITSQESGELCLLSGLFGENRDIFFPKLNENLHLEKFSDIAIRLLKLNGYDPVYCETEDEARSRIDELIIQNKWPCYFFASSTTGEKDFEEFFTQNERLELNRFEGIGVVKNKAEYDPARLIRFSDAIVALKNKKDWTKDALLTLFMDLLTDFKHDETGKNLDQRM